MANTNNNKNKESFIKKYKSDKKYKAQVQLIGYVILIFIIILFINVSSTGNTPLNDNPSSEIEQNDNLNNTEEKKSLLETINDNYQYDISVNLIRTNDEITTYNYLGKSYNNTLEINKNINGNIVTYQKIDDYYYKKEETDNILVAKEEIYDLISSEYIELNNLLTYINTASLDHVTNYSNGKKEFGYNLYIKDIVMNNQTNDVVNIKVIEENETLTIMADYSNLIKETNATIKECKVEYIFNNINKVDENADKLETSGDTNE